MHDYSDGAMAIPRMLSSIATGGSELSFLGKEDSGRGCDGEKDLLVQAIAPHLSRVMAHGTAKHVVAEGHEENPCVSIVAQAESKTVGLHRSVNRAWMLTTPRLGVFYLCSCFNSGQNLPL